MLASTMSAVSARMDAAFSGRPQVASYQFDGQTVQLDSQTRLSAIRNPTRMRRMRLKKSAQHG